MIVKKHIIETLDDLDERYNSSPTIFEATYYSKLAIIEGCGWIELTMDYIINQYINRKIKTAPFLKICNSFVKKNYGFDYENNFRKTLLPIIGSRQVEIIEKKLNSPRTGLIDILTAELNTLITHRNDASHTYIDTTKSYPAPDSTKTQILKIYPILKQIHAEIRNL